MLAVRLRSARKAKKLTQTELANKVNTKKTTISNYETGYSTPSNEMLSDLASILDVSTDYLLGRTENISTTIYNPYRELLEKYIRQSGLTIEQIIQLLKTHTEYDERDDDIQRGVDIKFFHEILSSDSLLYTYETLTRKLAGITGGDPDELIRAAVLSRFPSNFKKIIEETNIINKILKEFVDSLEKKGYQVVLNRYARKEGLEYNTIYQNLKETPIEELSLTTKIKLFALITDNGDRLKNQKEFLEAQTKNIKINLNDLLNIEPKDKIFLIKNKLFDLVINSQISAPPALSEKEAEETLFKYIDPYFYNEYDSTKYFVDYLFSEFFVVCKDEPSNVNFELSYDQEEPYDLENKKLFFLNNFEKISENWSIEQKSYFTKELFLDNIDNLNKAMSEIRFHYFIESDSATAYLPDERSPWYDNEILDTLFIKPDSYILDNLPRIDKILLIVDKDEEQYWTTLYLRDRHDHIIEDDSMIMDGIVKGSRVILNDQYVIEEGKIGLISISGGPPIVRRVFDHGETYFLQTSNHNFPTQTIPKDQVEIKGQVIKVEFDVN